MKTVKPGLHWGTNENWGGGGGELYNQDYIR